MSKKKSEAGKKAWVTRRKNQKLNKDGKDPIIVEAGKKAAVTRKKNLTIEKKRIAAYKAWKTMREKYGDNCAIEFGKKASVTRKKNLKKLASA